MKLGRRWLQGGHNALNEDCMDLPWLMETWSPALLPLQDKSAEAGSSIPFWLEPHPATTASLDINPHVTQTQLKPAQGAD